MPDRVVYLVEELTAAHREAVLKFVDAEGLQELLAQGYETGTTLENQKVKLDGKSVKATMMILKMAAENRGVTVSGHQHQERGQELMTIQDEYGRSRQVTLGEAIVHSNRQLAETIAEQGRHVGHLGAPSRPKIPGLTIISSEVVQQAYDAGQLAAARGEPVSACPMPPGTEAATKWLQGYRASQDRVAKEDAVPIGVTAAQHAANWASREQVCHDEGERMAKSVAKEDVVHNPYERSHPRLRAAWIRGFQAGGGTVE